MSVSAIKTGALMTLLVMMIALLCLNGRAADQAPDHSIKAFGSAVISGKDVAKAREQALDNALASSVARMVSEHLPEESLIKQFKKLNETIFNHTDQYVDSYKVLAEALVGKTYRVMVQATVATPKINRELSALKLLNKPETPLKILILLSSLETGDMAEANESDTPTQLNDLFVTDLLSRQFIKKNMKVIGADKLDKIVKPEDSDTRPVITNATALQYGRRVQADAVIIGQFGTVLTPNTMGTDVRSFKGVVNLRALRTGSGVQIASADRTNLTVSDDENAGRKKSLTNASVAAGKMLASQIAAVWTKNSSQPGISPAMIVEIIVEGTGSLSNFVMFRRFLSELPGVEEIRIKEMKADEAKITVRFQGDGKKLADILMMKSYETFGIDIFEVTSQKIKVELIPG